MNNESSSLNRRERKKERTRKAIIGTALTLFARQGFDSTSMEQIAQEADIAKATLYNYFPNKEAIISGYMRETVRENETEINRIICEKPDTRSRLTAFLTQMHSWNEANRELVRMYSSIKLNELVTSPAENGKRSGNLEQVLARILQLGREAGEIRNDMPVEILALYLKVMYLVPFINWLSGTNPSEQDKQFVEMVELFLSGAQASGEGIK
ncbi:MAG TPA: TetR/AcrR family transcriptional regulator [Desulfotomaculum sp.]|nr:MAG: hypothetical protein VR67_07035 [Peptococcaceae bacterium BRH_c8a]KJS73584.1 MAG: hypothetical protein JL56_10870 [Desulfotomaculum sp. BICA1-6]HBX23111.1 TetR/AcrR family transcriptional regulator [Desulfotomaculum sp.]